MQVSEKSRPGNVQDIAYLLHRMHELIIKLVQQLRLLFIQRLGSVPLAPPAGRGVDNLLHALKGQAKRIFFSAQQIATTRVMPVSQGISLVNGLDVKVSRVKALCDTHIDFMAVQVGEHT